MRTHCHVENHNPVPLRPLREVLADAMIGFEPAVVYVEGEVEDEYGPYPVKGWGIVGDDTITFDFEGRWCWLNNLDGERTMARSLQPGERLVVSYGA